MALVLTGAAAVNKLEKFSPASKFIELIEFDPKQQTMDITFRSGTKYRYLEVSSPTFLSFKGSPTIDAFYSRAIKGNINSVKLVDNSIGHQKSTPLNKIKQERTLDAGLRKQRTVGTVNRAFVAA